MSIGTMRRYLAVLAAILLSGAGLAWTLDRIVGTDEVPAGDEETSPRPAESARPTLTLAFGGDIHFEGRIGDVLADDPSAVLAGVDQVLEAADVAMVNVETAITTGGTKANKQYTFRAPPSAFRSLAAGGVDIASIANNHGMDYGPVGLEDTLDAGSDADITVLGGGRDAEEAYRHHIVEVKGQRIAFIAATQVLDDDLIDDWTATDTQPGLASAKDVPRLIAAVRAAREAADTVVLYLHWGAEEETCPTDAQKELARELVGAGADVVVGGHAHRLQGAGRLDRAVVAYGLGNFVFYADAGPATDTGVLVVEVSGREVKGYDWVPARLVNQLPRTLTGSAANAARRSWEALRSCTGLAS